MLKWNEVPNRYYRSRLVFWAKYLWLRSQGRVEWVKPAHGNYHHYNDDGVLGTSEPDGTVRHILMIRSLYQWSDTTCRSIMLERGR